MEAKTAVFLQKLRAYGDAMVDSYFISVDTPDKLSAAVRKAIELQTELVTMYMDGFKKT